MNWSCSSPVVRSKSSAGRWHLLLGGGLRISDANTVTGDRTEKIHGKPMTTAREDASWGICLKCLNHGPVKPSRSSFKAKSRSGPEWCRQSPTIIILVVVVAVVVVVVAAGSVPWDHHSPLLVDGYCFPEVIASITPLSIINHQR